MQGIINTVKWRWPKWGMRHPVRPEQEEGLTLIEMLAVVVILGIVATIAVPTVTNAIGQAKINATESDLGTLQTALSLYYSDTGSYPTNAQLSDLANPTTGPATGLGPPPGPGPAGYNFQIPNFPENDAWGNPIYYQVLGGGTGYVLLSGDGQALSVTSSPPTGDLDLEDANTPLASTGTTKSLTSTSFIYAAGGTGLDASGSSPYVATGPTVGKLSSNLAAAIDYEEVTAKTPILPADQ